MNSMRAYGLIAILSIATVLLSGCNLSTSSKEPLPPPPTGTNLVQNGSFEDVQGGSAVGYSFSTYAGEIRPVIDSTVARTGTNSVRLDGDGSSRPVIRLRTAIDGGYTYKVSLWYRHDGDDDGQQIGKSLLRIMTFDGSASNKIIWDMDWISDLDEGDYLFDGENLRILAAEEAVDEWEILTVTFTLPTNVSLMDIEAFNWLGEGKVWFDDLSLERL